MTARFRLFTRDHTLNQNQTFSPPDMYFIVLIESVFDDTVLRKELKRFPGCIYIRKFTKINCLNSLLHLRNETIFINLIISNQFVDFTREHLLEITPRLSDIYVFDSTQDKSRKLTDYRFRGPFTSTQPLIREIQFKLESLKRFERASAGIIYLTGKESAKFFWYQFFFKILRHLKHSNIAKREMVAQMRSFGESKVHQQSLIDQFESDYHASTAIHCYTRESPFFRLLNQALWSQDINRIFPWRMAISDIHNGLQSLKTEKPFDRRWLFHGLALPQSDIDNYRQNIGKLTTASGFFSTTTDSNIAKTFANAHSNQFRRPVLLNIQTDVNFRNIVAPDISNLSAFSGEREHLFTLRSMFRVKKVELIDHFWHIDLAAVNEDDQEYCRIVNPWKISIGEHSFFRGRLEPLFSRFLNDENSSFLAFQLLIDMMLRLHRTEFAQAELIEACREDSAHSSKDLQMIDHFLKNYRVEDAIRWYTTDSFLYRVLQKALRLENINCIFKLRYYIQDLHNQLAQQQNIYFRSLSSIESILHLYRGQRMRFAALKELRQNIDGLISMNSFLSTTNDCQAAAFFAGVDSLDDPNQEVSVLYQITVDLSVAHSIPFAAIQHQSIYRDEDEVLFSMAAVFRISEIEQYGRLWVVDLTLISKEDEQWNQLISHLDE